MTDWVCDYAGWYYVVFLGETELGRLPPVLCYRRYAARRTADRFSLIGLQRLQQRIDRRRPHRVGRTLHPIELRLEIRDEIVRRAIA